MSYDIQVEAELPGGVPANKEMGGLDVTSSLEAKYGAKSGQVHQIRGKIWKVLSPQDAKVWKSPNLGSSLNLKEQNLGCLSHIFGGKIWGSNKNFTGKFWDQAPLTSLYGSTTPWAEFKNCTYNLQNLIVGECSNIILKLATVNRSKVF